VIEGVWANRNIYVDQLNLPNEGLIDNLPPGAIVEVPGLSTGAGVKGLGMGSLPEPIAELCRRELAYDAMAVDASYHGDREMMLRALLFDPTVTDIQTARETLDHLLEEFAEYLPQFQH
jgi:alpha-galactosidase